MPYDPDARPLSTLLHLQEALLVCSESNRAFVCWTSGGDPAIRCVWVVKYGGPQSACSQRPAFSTARQCNATCHTSVGQVKSARDSLPSAPLCARDLLRYSTWDACRIDHTLWLPYSPSPPSSCYATVSISDSRSHSVHCQSHVNQGHIPHFPGLPSQGYQYVLGVPRLFRDDNMKITGPQPIHAPTHQRTDAPMHRPITVRASPPPPHA